MTEEVFVYLKAHQEEIMKAASGGDKLAVNIITFYRMYIDCAEAGAHGMLAAAVDEWKKRAGAE